MAHHTVETTAATAINYFDRSSPAVLRVEPGDTLTVHTMDAGGFLARPVIGEPEPARFFPVWRGHTLVGPIAIAGARPGQVLAVRLDELVPDDWGRTNAAARDSWLNKQLGLSVPDDATMMIWDIDSDRGVATNNLGISTILRPFLGVLGVAFDVEGQHATGPPRPIGGGNIDCRSLVAGSTLYLPITMPDAMLYVGDGHAMQGDGEVSGTAIECGMTTTFTVSLLDEAPVEGIHALTPEGRITFAFHENLNEAVAVALDRMVSWLMQLHDLDRANALALASVVVDLRVTQVANGTWGIHALLPEGVIVAAAG